jgi:OOP family OmpA-OmpF porin
MNKLLMAAALSASLMAGPAAAEMYLGAGAGRSDTDAGENSWKLYLGYQFSPTWGLELGFNDLGKFRGADVESWTLAGTATMPMGERWSLLGKLGAASNRAHFAGAQKNTELLAGVGVGFGMTKNLGLRLEYENFGKLSKSGTGEDSRGSNVALSVKYSF